MEDGVLNGIQLITPHAMPPAVHARWNETAWKSGGRKPLHRNFRAPHYTLPLGTFTLFISHLMKCLCFFPPAFQAPHKFALVLVSLSNGQKVRRRVGGHYDACLNFILLNFNYRGSFDFATGLLFPELVKFPLKLGGGVIVLKCCGKITNEGSPLENLYGCMLEYKKEIANKERSIYFF